MKNQQKVYNKKKSGHKINPRNANILKTMLEKTHSTIDLNEKTCVNDDLKKIQSDIKCLNRLNTNNNLIDDNKDYLNHIDPKVVEYSKKFENSLYESLEEQLKSVQSPEKMEELFLQFMKTSVEYLNVIKRASYIAQLEDELESKFICLTKHFVGNSKFDKIKDTMKKDFFEIATFVMKEKINIGYVEITMLDDTYIITNSYDVDCPCIMDDDDIKYFNEQCVM